ncbi:MAG: LSU ribosomal protein L23p (L23Ae) [uncultured Thermomicrobiales bacterium]|uniref:Large ribosomal subunit protein uL23 n=1 Tax=uncultured Thermomicrobiales bacterium TaxID=1645740 RepID=A0A6J4V731_9BACT|nr:MAG: LSU ribosomal protein L23p (L23Ae) [uncultured Thermomicrobiales bacterium]
MPGLRIEDVLRRPIITEKNTMLMEQGQYTFEVAPDANKIQIKQAVEEAFNVKVKAVNTLNVKPKARVRGTRGGRGRISGHERARKKAYVTLAPGQTLDPFDL